jgi:hypothetical protein
MIMAEKAFNAISSIIKLVSFGPFSENVFPI